MKSIIILYTFLSFDNGIRQKICSRMLYGIACGTRGWVYISSHGVGYYILSLSACYCVAFGRSASTFLVLSMMTVVACTAGRITVDMALHV